MAEALVRNETPSEYFRELVDIDYDIQLGGSADGSLARQGHATFGEVFTELSEKFPAFVDVWCEASEIVMPKGGWTIGRTSRTKRRAR